MDSQAVRSDRPQLLGIIRVTVAAIGIALSSVSAVCVVATMVRSFKLYHHAMAEGWMSWALIATSAVTACACTLTLLGKRMRMLLVVCALNECALAVFGVLVVGLEWWGHSGFAVLYSVPGAVIKLGLSACGVATSVACAALVFVLESHRSESCPQCGYPRHSRAAGVCPECGRADEAKRS